MRIVVIADPRTCLAFSLGGIDTRPVDGPEEAAMMLKSLQVDKEVGLILITERIADTIREQVDQVVLGSPLPLLLEIPDTRGPVPDRKSTKERMIALMGR